MKPTSTTITARCAIVTAICLFGCDDPVQEQVEPDSGAIDDSGAPDDGGLPSDPVVLLDSGAVRGLIDGNVRVFHGIPYAAPPVGSNRWKPPIPVTPWQETFDATEPGERCPQADPMFGMATGREDCLTLTVWSPYPLPPEPLPVLVWIHGGAYLLGTGHDDQYDGYQLAGANQMILVSMNYRLGALGFLAHPALSNEPAGQPTSGNYGMLDQQFALRWVQENIAAFGGDPHNITLFGHSAGAMSIMGHLLSGQSTGLFHRAILQSGVLTSKMLEPLSAAEQRGLQWAEALGCPDSVQVLSCLRQLPADRLITSLAATTEPGGVFYQGEDDVNRWGPNLDGAFLPLSAADALVSGQFDKVPLIIGTVADEGTIFHHYVIGAIEVVDEIEYREALGRYFQHHVDAIIDRYAPDDFASANEALIEVTTDAFFVCPTRRMARAFSSAGVEKFLYTFERPPETPMFAELEVYHSAELMFVFGNDGSLGRIGQAGQELARSMGARWSRFALTGTPDDPLSTLSWPAYDATTDLHLTFDLPLSTGSGHKKERCDFWDGIHDEMEPQRMVKWFPATDPFAGRTSE